MTIRSLPGSFPQVDASLNHITLVNIVAYKISHTILIFGPELLRPCGTHRRAWTRSSACGTALGGRENAWTSRARVPLPGLSIFGACLCESLADQRRMLRVQDG